MSSARALIQKIVDLVDREGELEPSLVATALGFVEERDAALLREERARALENRGIETPCSRCGGSGVRAYANTATWNRGVGGNMITSDVCDHCWGSGDEHRKWVNLRDKQADLARERARLSELEGVDKVLDDTMEIVKKQDETIDELKARLNEVRKLADKWKNSKKWAHDHHQCEQPAEECCADDVLAILDRKESGGSVAGEAEPLSDEPPANSDRSAR